MTALYSEAEQQKIRELSEEIGFDPEDPMFQIMSILGSFEEMMIQFPAQMEALLEAGALMFDDKLSNATKAAEVMQHAVITAAVKEVLKQEMQKLKPTVSLPIETPQIGKVKLGMWSIAGILGGMIAVGTMLGSLTTWNVVSNFTPRADGITESDMKILRWAKSTDGRIARQLLVDNKTTLGACIKEERLKGHCLIKIRKTK